MPFIIAKTVTYVSSLSVTYVTTLYNVGFQLPRMKAVLLAACGGIELEEAELDGALGKHCVIIRAC